MTSCSSQEGFSSLTKEGQGIVFIYFVVKLKHRKRRELLVLSIRVQPASHGACFLSILLQP